MDIQAGTIQKQTYYFNDAGRDMEYATFTPSGYREGIQTPLVVLLHPLFSNPHQVIRFAGITAEAEKRGYIVVAPFGYNDRGWYGSVDLNADRKFLASRISPSNLGELSEKDVLNVLAIACQEFTIDRQRIYLMGASMGGAGTLHLGSSYPDIWAAIAPMAPAIRKNSPTRFVDSTSRQIPVMLVTGDKDWITPVEPARRWVAEAKEAGTEVRYVELPGGTHAWPACRPKVVAEIFDFLSQHHRPAPAAVPRFTPSANSGDILAPDADLSPSRRSCRLRDLKSAGDLVYRHGRKGLMPAAFRILHAVSFLEAELFAWSIFYKVKSRWNAVAKFCQDAMLGHKQD